MMNQQPAQALVGSSGVRPVDPSSVQAEFETLGSVLAMLEKRIQLLSERLDPIRRTDIAQKPVGQNAPIPPACCRVAQATREVRERLGECDSAIERIIESIAL